MRIPLACVISLCTALALPAAAPGALSLGVVDDAPKAALDGGETFYGLMADLGMSENRITMLRDPSSDAAAEEALLASIVPAAQLRGIRIVLAVYPAKARAMASSPSAPAEFIAYVASRSSTPTGAERPAPGTRRCSQLRTTP